MLILSINNIYQQVKTGTDIDDLLLFVKCLKHI